MKTLAEELVDQKAVLQSAMDILTGAMQDLTQGVDPNNIRQRDLEKRQHTVKLARRFVETHDK